MKKIKIFSVLRARQLGSVGRWSVVRSTGPAVGRDTAATVSVCSPTTAGARGDRVVARGRSVRTAVGPPPSGRGARRRRLAVPGEIETRAINNHRDVLSRGARGPASRAAFSPLRIISSLSVGLAGDRRASLSPGERSRVVGRVGPVGDVGDRARRRRNTAGTGATGYGEAVGLRARADARPGSGRRSHGARATATADGDRRRCGGAASRRRRSGRVPGRKH